MLTSFHSAPAARLGNRCFIVRAEHKTKTNPKSNKTQLICACGEVSRSFLSPETLREGTTAPKKPQTSRRGKIYTPSTDSCWYCQGGPQSKDAHP